MNGEYVMKKVLIIVGSFRRNSFNLQLAKEIESIIGERACVSYLEYSDIPYMNQDIENPVPESIARVRKAVQDADGIWISSPEYNYNIPGVLKNLLDWLSRPVDPDDRKSGSAVRGKPVSITGVAGRSAAAGVRKSLKTLLEIMSMNVIGGMGNGVVLEAETFKTGVLTLTEEEKSAINNQLENFLSEI